MNNPDRFEQDFRAFLEQDAQDARHQVKVTRGMLRRIRRRQVATSLVTALVVVAVVAGSATATHALLPLGEKGKRLEPAAGSQVPDVAQITCANGQTIVSTPEVRPQDDGYHFLVQAQDGATGLKFNEPGSKSYDTVWGTTASSFEVVYPSHPGDILVACHTYPNDVQTPEPDAPIHLYDPTGTWHDPHLSCDNQGHFAAWVDPAIVPKDWNLAAWNQVVGDILTGIQPGDVVDYTGFPNSEHQHGVEIVRDGSVVAVIGAGLPVPSHPALSQGATHGPLVPIPGIACADSGIGEPASSSPTPQASPSPSEGAAAVLQPGETRNFAPGELQPGDLVRCRGRGSLHVPDPTQFSGIGSSVGFSLHVEPDGSVKASCDSGPVPPI